jgi:beta-glucanase (GH16 family)/predicted RNA-binding protein with TRAM domain
MVDLTGYKLTFSDEFNSRSISQTGSDTTWANIRSEWRLDANSDIGFGDSSFVDAASGYDPFKVADGALSITAAPPDTTKYGYPGSWDSGLIHTKESFSQKYGYFEMRADLPAGEGIWDAFWLLPDDNRPEHREIDIIEHYGNDYIYSWTHTDDPDPNGANVDRQTFSDNPGILDGYHTFGLEWTPTHLNFYYDGELRGSQVTPSDMHDPMYILANLAMESKADPNKTYEPFKIDYIRAYSKDPNAEAIELGPISSPDGADTSNLHGAQTADSSSIPSLPSIPPTNSPVTPPSGQAPDGPSASPALPTTPGANAGGSQGGTPTSGNAPAPSAPTAPVQAGDGDLVLKVSGDRFEGDPRFQVFVDGQQVGDTYGVSAVHEKGEWQNILIEGDFDHSAAHKVEFRFVNDAWDCKLGEGHDRNLYLEEFTIDGKTVDVGAIGDQAPGHFDNDAGVLARNGSLTFDTGASASPALPTTPGANAGGSQGGTPTSGNAPAPSAPTAPVQAGDGDLVLKVSGDRFEGDPRFQVFVDGQQVGDTYGVSAVHEKGEWQNILIEGDFDHSAAHKVEFRFVNDAWDCKLGEGHDRNLYLEEFTIDGKTVDVGAIGDQAPGHFDNDAGVLARNGSLTFDTGWLSQ